MIDGFDPDKFRKVNKQPGGGLPPVGSNAAGSKPGLSSLPPPRQTFVRRSNSNSFSNNNNIDDDDDFGRSPPSPYRGGGGSTMDMPGAAVPTYDRTEQQLLQTLEQELGVL